MRTTTCQVPGCTSELNGHGPICTMHRFRYRRTGTYDPRPPKTYVASVDPSNGYVRISVPKSHPLAKTSTTTVWLHRVVLFDAIGLGPHRCHWCGCHINWRAGLLVDHIDGNGRNNAPGNLVPACNSCNLCRAFALRAWRKQRASV